MMRNFQIDFISNKTTARFFKILNFMEYTKVFTLKDIAEKNRMSERTIANDIRYLKDFFKDSIQLISGNSGYIFKQNNITLYRLRKQELLDNECLFEIIRDIFNGNLKEIDDLAHKYHYSESGFRRLLNKCTITLNSYGLNWKSNPLTIEGDEVNIRKFFKDFYYEGIEMPYAVVPDKDLTEMIIKKASENVGKYEWGSGTTPTSFLYSLHITIKRVEQGQFVDLPAKLKDIVYQRKDFPFLWSLSCDIEKIFQVSIPKSEFAWIYLINICKRTHNRLDLELDFYETFNLWPEIQEFVDKFFKKLRINDKEEKEVSSYIGSFLISQKVKDSIAPVLNKESRDLIEMVINYNENGFLENLEFIEKNINIYPVSKTYIKDICAALTLYLDLIFDTHIGKKNIFFLLEGNHFIRQFIEKKAMILFGSKHKLTFLPIHSLSSEVLNSESVDLVVTNYSHYLSEYVAKEYILTKFIPDDDDWILIKNNVSPNNF